MARSSRARARAWTSRRVRHNSCCSSVSTIRRNWRAGSPPMSLDFVNVLKAHTGSSAWLMCSAGAGATVLGAGSLEIDAALNEAVLKHAQPFTGASRVDGVLSYGSYFPLRDISGQVIGMG